RRRFRGIVVPRGTEATSTCALTAAAPPLPGSRAATIPRNRVPTWARSDLHMRTHRSRAATARVPRGLGDDSANRGPTWARSDLHMRTHRNPAATARVPRGLGDDSAESWSHVGPKRPRDAHSPQPRRHCQGPARRRFRGIVVPRGPEATSTCALTATPPPLPRSRSTAATIPRNRGPTWGRGGPQHAHSPQPRRHCRGPARPRRRFRGIVVPRGTDAARNMRNHRSTAATAVVPLGLGSDSAESWSHVGPRRPATCALTAAPPPRPWSRSASAAIPRNRGPTWDRGALNMRTHRSTAATAMILGGLVGDSAESWSHVGPRRPATCALTAAPPPRPWSRSASAAIPRNRGPTWDRGGPQHAHSPHPAATAMVPLGLGDDSAESWSHVGPRRPATCALTASRCHCH